MVIDMLKNNFDCAIKREGSLFVIKALKHNGDFHEGDLGYEKREIRRKPKYESYSPHVVTTFREIPYWNGQTPVDWFPIELKDINEDIGLARYILPPVVARQLNGGSVNVIEEASTRQLIEELRRRTEGGMI
jgi:hypothetical protein